MRFPETRDAALVRLAAFVPLAGRPYAARRNYDAGPDGAATTSLLSPAIRRRLIAEDEVCGAAVAAHGAEGAEKFIAEVCWRSYWVGWLVQRPGVWRQYLADVVRLRERVAADAALATRLAAAENGTTGIDCFDAWAAELVATGWLHNHVRMNFASIWVFTLGLPWQLGADFFYRHLIDACPASNTCSWRWVAGLHTRGKAYLADAQRIRDLAARPFRIDVPLAPAPRLLPDAPLPPAVPPPPAQRPDPALRSGLFVHTDDLGLERLALPACVAVAATSHIPGQPAALKRRVAETALTDGVTRAAVVLGVASERLDDENALAAMRDWTARHRLRQVITAEAPVGPVRDRLDALHAALAADGIALVRVRRAWDAIAWPAATRGFFAFRPFIPRLLQLPAGALAE